jgi:predicted regulator of Ras-like GTPase activity (Roadblock/LC7/MglB family)
MFGFLKPLLRKLVETPEDTAPPPPSSEFDSAETYETPSPATALRTFGSGRTPQPARQQSQQSAKPNGKAIDLPLQIILQTLPLELQPRVLYPEVGDATIAVPLEKILAQLARGAVKISFGELRMAAPGVFSTETDRDRVLVPLPLEEILSRLNPALITRRRAQKHVEVPAEICSPFDPEAQNGPKTQPAPAPTALPPTRQTASAPMQNFKPTAPAAPIAPARGGMSSAPTPPPPSAIPTPSMLFAPRPTREPDVKPPGPIPFKTASAQGPAGAPSLAPKPASTPAPASKPLPTPAAPVAKAAPAPASTAEPAAVRSAKPTEATGIMVGLTALAESWPEAVRKEIVQWNLVDARVALPMEGIEQGLKQGKIAYSWKTVRSWLTPAVLAEFSPNDNIVVELPLKIVAPLFLARQREVTESRQKVAVDAEIPNLFFGFPQSEASPNTESVPQASTAVAKPVDTNYYIWDDNSESARIDASEYKRPTAETRFISRCATPNEVVSRAAAIEGVEGALIALPDGLMVASQISPDLNGDTIAAFLPQIFSKVSQCTKELRMGELNNLNFTVGNVPWKIFRVNAIFFAAFGKAGQSLPTSQLAALASELDHKAK